MKNISIVIVCMNNLKNLLPCIDSIKGQTKRSDYDIWVVAYLFSFENLAILRSKHPDITIVESNEIRGFSENNNLALRQIMSNYVLILNDDTIFKMPVLDRLMDSMAHTPDASFLSPQIVFADGRFQYCGRGPTSIIDYLLQTSSINIQRKKRDFYSNREGIFKTYCCIGACILAKTEVLRQLNFFDEYYFFMPEDIALSTKANKEGYHLYVDSNVILHHYQQQTGRKLKPATLPASRKGSIHFYAQGNKTVYYFAATYIFIMCIIKSLLFLIIGDHSNYKAQWHCVQTIFSSKTPKEIFAQYYQRLKQ